MVLRRKKSEEATSVIFVRSRSLLHCDRLNKMAAVKGVITLCLVLGFALDGFAIPVKSWHKGEFKNSCWIFSMELRLGCSGAFSLVTFPETQRYNNPRLVQPSCSGFLKFFRGSADLPPKMSLFLQYTTICMICTESWKIKTSIGRNNTKMFVKIFLLL